MLLRNSYSNKRTSPDAYGIQAVGQCDSGLGEAQCLTGDDDLALEFIAVANALATGRWNPKFWVCSVHVST